MRKQLFYLILAGLIINTVFSYAQNTDLPIKEINGTEYYLYSVEVSEGLYAISKKFNISIEEIKTVNPEVKDGLRFGQKILIPIQNNNIKNQSASTKFTEHIVEKRQTLFAISRKYGVSQEDVIKNNPEITSGLKTGMVLKIPITNPDKKTKTENKSAQIKTSAENKAPELTTKHTVQAGETLYSISKLHNTEVNKIVELNPGAENKISIGMELKIPNQESKTTLSDSSNENTTNSAHGILNLETIFKNTDDKSSLNENNKSIRLAFLLPFMLDQQKSDLNTDRFVNFYAGSLLAIKDAKEKGISMQIYSYDTGKTEESMQSTLSNPELKTMDFIIGPAYSNQVSLMADFARENSIHTLIPFSSKVVEIETNPYLFQFNPGVEYELKFSTELLTGKLKKTNVIFADISDINYDDGKILSEKLKRNLTLNKKSFSTIQLTSTISDNFVPVLKKNEKNLIIFNTDKFSSVNAFIANLKELSNSFDITLFEQYSWKDQPENLAQTMLISPFISSIDQKQISSFNQKFTENFNWNVSTDTPRYDLLGYDISSFFIKYLTDFGKNFPEKSLSKIQSNWIQSKPDFIRASPAAGFTNQQLYLTEDKKD